MSALIGKQRVRLLAAASLILVVITIGYVMSRQTDWKVLYGSLADKDGGAVVAQLSQMNIPYKTMDGGAIMVPAEKVHEVRLRLASQGLPRGSTAGFDLMDNTRFGMTQFQERLTFQRGLEGELTRTIQSMGSVQGARVHLALPQQNGFFREQQKPSASVMLSLHPGRSLDRGQVAGIVHLVSSSVPELDPKAVSVIDDTGQLLSSPNDPSAGVDAAQLQQNLEMERSLARRIEDILSPVLGRQNVRAQVSVDVDYSQVQTTSETHGPNQSSGAIRSQQVVENSGAAQSQIAGIPGASSNQPRAQASAPINGAGSAVTTQQTLAAGTSGRRESITNYEVDRTVRTVRASVGVVRRITAAVVVNDPALAANASPQDGKKAETPEIKPLTPEQLEQYSALVKEAVGFNAERGDSVKLVSAAFTVQKIPAIETPWWKEPETLGLARNIIWLLGVLAVSALTLLVVVRPLIRGLRHAASAVEPIIDAVVSDPPERPPLPPAQPNPPAPAPPALVLTPMESDPNLQTARKLAQDNPAAVADIVKSWINGDN